MHNAFKNTLPGGRVVLRARGEQGRLLTETEDECGGIPQDKSDLFQVFGDRRGSDWSGLGLGLSIARKAVRAHDGDIRVRNMPGKRCVFIIDVPLAASATQVLMSSPKATFRTRSSMPVAIVIRAEGAMLECVLEAAHPRALAAARPWPASGLPRGFVSPQVTIVSAKPSTDVFDNAASPRDGGATTAGW